MDTTTPRLSLYNYSPAILVKVYLICLELVISFCLFCAKHRKVMRNNLSPLQWLEKNIMLTQDEA